MNSSLPKKAFTNAELHCLGSCKIMAGIGKGFAEAMTPFHDKTLRK